MSRGWAVIALLAVSSCAEQGDKTLNNCQRAVAFSANSHAIGATLCSPIAVWQAGRHLLGRADRAIRRSFAPHS